MSRRIFYNAIKRAVTTGSQDDVTSLLERISIEDIHGCLCEELLAEPPTARCAKCEHLFSLRQRDTGMARLLMEQGAYPPLDVCSSPYRYSDKASTPLKLAIDSGSIDDVRKLLAQGADVNFHPRVCLKNRGQFDDDCTDCDSPLIAAVRRRDVTMIRLLLTHGASVCEAIRADAAGGSSKTALLVAAGTGDRKVIRELVKAGADVNQSLGPRSTVLHHFCKDDSLVNLLVRLGADPNARAERGGTVFWQVLLRGLANGRSNLRVVLQSLRLLLPKTRNLDEYLQSTGAVHWLYPACTMLLLQHGARIDYSKVFLAEESPAYWSNQAQHSEQFIQLLRAADTDFSGVRQRIASLDRKKWEVLNLDVLEEKLSQPLTLQTSCVISMRRHLRSISDVGLWAKIDALPLPKLMKNRLKLIVW